MAKLRLTLACGPYDRTQALRDGTIAPDGIELTYLDVQAAEIFWRMLQYREFDVSEMSLSNYITLVAQGEAPFVAIPVFPSRVFRHGYIFVNTAKGIERPSDLVGKRGGVPEYSQTAAVYIRGLLEHEYGVKPSQVEWVQGRLSRLAHGLPPDVRVTAAPPGVELSDLLVRGEIDFLTTGNNPLPFRRGVPSVQRLFPNYRALEQDYYRRTRIYPIMHTVVIRRDVYERDPWVAPSLYRAFVAAKEHCYRLLLETGSPKASFAWLQPTIEEEQAIIGADWFPYGIAPNRASLEALLQYTHEQGLTERRVRIEELFAPGTLHDIPLGEDLHLQ
jgi:4,5-dihydroxyphthalate decarboxylase